MANKKKQICTNDQPTDKRTSCYINADNLCITSQESFFEVVKQNLTDSLTLLIEYYAKKPPETKCIKDSGVCIPSQK